MVAAGAVTPGGVPILAAGVVTAPRPTIGRSGKTLGKRIAPAPGCSSSPAVPVPASVVAAASTDAEPTIRLCVGHASSYHV